MREHTQSLPHQPPRQYNLRDAYRERVWRSPLGVIGRSEYRSGFGVPPPRLNAENRGLRLGPSMDEPRIREDLKEEG